MTVATSRLGFKLTPQFPDNRIIQKVPTSILMIRHHTNNFLLTFDIFSIRKSNPEADTISHSINPFPCSSVSQNARMDAAVDRRCVSLNEQRYGEENINPARQTISVNQTFMIIRLVVMKCWRAGVSRNGIANDN